MIAPMIIAMIMVTIMMLLMTMKKIIAAIGSDRGIITIGVTPIAIVPRHLGVATAFAGDWRGIVSTR